MSSIGIGLVKRVLDRVIQQTITLFVKIESGNLQVRRLSHFYRGIRWGIDGFRGVGYEHHVDVVLHVRQHIRNHDGKVGVMDRGIFRCDFQIFVTRHTVVEFRTRCRNRSYTCRALCNFRIHNHLGILTFYNDILHERLMLVDIPVGTLQQATVAAQNLISPIEHTASSKRILRFQPRTILIVVQGIGTIITTALIIAHSVGRHHRVDGRTTLQIVL